MSAGNEIPTGGLSMPLHDLVALNLTGHIGSVRLQRLLDYFNGSTAKILSASQSQLERVYGIGAIIAKHIVDVRNSDRVGKELEDVEKAGVSLIPFYSPQYPETMKGIPDYPIILYVKGTITDADCLAIAIVGTRYPTTYGRYCAERFAFELAELGITVVSGLAKGIDTFVHTAALNAKDGRTIAVLGSGLNRIYPPENEKLSHRICESGAVISEFGINTLPDAVNFPRRNRIISGLSLGTVVVEAGEKSGALITADFAVSHHGKDVFAIPGNIDSAESEGCNKLIKEGAKMATSVEDILEEIPQFHNILEQLKNKQVLTPVEQLILSCIDDKHFSLDAISLKANLPQEEVRRILEDIKDKNIVSENGEGEFVNRKAINISDSEA